MQAIVAQLICYATHNVLRPKKDLAEVIASYCAPQPPIVYVATYRSMSHDRPRRRAWTSEKRFRPLAKKSSAQRGNLRDSDSAETQGLMA